MLQKLRHRLDLILGSVPILATLTVTASSSIAATFSSSSTNIFLSEFSSVPANVGIIATPDLFLSSNGGSVDGSADFNPIFIENNPVASDSSFAFVEGEGQGYTGTAKTDVSLIGNNFFVEAGSTFSFDFLAELELETFIDNPGGENAIAQSNISFFLFSSENDTLLDFFSISAQIETDEPGDFLSVQSSSNFTLLLDDSDGEFGENEEFIEAVYIGGFSREFSEDTTLRLVAATTNHASVKAPEPNSVVAVLVFGVVGGVLRKRKSL
ncbi:MAG: hypothetical protein SWJ54_03120 [Cyanobacteriota bacterium]|nr:hypothetical protein [Cyanobacteriota bacterium]